MPEEHRRQMARDGLYTLLDLRDVKKPFPKAKKTDIEKIINNEGVVNLFSLTAKGMYRRQHGFSYFSGGLRSFRGELKDGIHIAKNPWKVIKLNKSSFSGWHSIIKELVNIQRRGSHKQLPLKR